MGRARGKMFKGSRPASECGTAKYLPRRRKFPRIYSVTYGSVFHFRIDALAIVWLRSIMPREERKPFEAASSFIFLVQMISKSADWGYHGRLHIRNVYAKRHGRNLVTCIDDTSNRFGIKNTNIVELYTQPVRVKNNTQLTYYNSGIETYAKHSKKTFSYWLRILDHKVDLAIAWNFDRIVKRRYRWLAENYNEGDLICLFGFSRGAYQLVQIIFAQSSDTFAVHTPTRGSE
ncbi:hypothetical protein A0H81_11003 [Grifola frondosa]|uniref:T6SS Phospholipase effector Tle1-like catalytic domain-containing protein n=1 Tax=Grifola frondosa TaxID=5627 RepID=A0A1C7LXS4_GRIFR|nr:hypothetical protein A0H81_11003 [Grifola frondosa]